MARPLGHKGVRSLDHRGLDGSCAMCRTSGEQAGQMPLPGTLEQRVPRALECKKDLGDEDSG